MLVSVGPFDYRRCPVLELEPEHQVLVEQWRTGAAPEGVERWHAPSAVVDACEFLDALKREVTGGN